MASAKGRKKKMTKKRVAKRRKPFRPMITSRETWILMQEVSDLVQEAARLLAKAGEYDDALKDNRKYSALAKKLDIEP